MTRNRRKKRKEYFWGESIIDISGSIFHSSYDEAVLESLFRKKNNKVKFKYITRKGNGV